MIGLFSINCITPVIYIEAGKGRETSRIKTKSECSWFLFIAHGISLWCGVMG